METISAKKLEEHVKLYVNAARSAGDRPRIALQVTASTDDQIFRSTLDTLALAGFSQIRVIVNQADKK